MFLFGVLSRFFDFFVFFDMFLTFVFRHVLCVVTFCFCFVFLCYLLMPSEKDGKRPAASNSCHCAKVPSHMCSATRCFFLNKTDDPCKCFLMQFLFVNKRKSSSICLVIFHDFAVDFPGLFEYVCVRHVNTTGEGVQTNACKPPHAIEKRGETSTTPTSNDSVSKISRDSHRHVMARCRRCKMRKNREERLQSHAGKPDQGLKGHASATV